MTDSMRKCYVAVSDLALCQRCPMLLAYKIHMGKKSAWSVGIHGNGSAYGSAFHKHISRVFFDAASRIYHPLHDEIIHAVSAGGFELENIIRENIFMPFVAENSQKFSSGQIISMAKGVTVWVKAMSEFFRCIPSLARHSESNMQLIFSEPEQKLRSDYRFDDYGTICITGCYDALMFNPDRREARLFEFKGYMKSDITVPLSQSLIYSWLIWRNTGIVPSVEIIYLDESDKQPDIFDSDSVGKMMTPALPELFQTAFDILTLRRKQEILQDKDLCTICRYRKHCRRDMTNLFLKAGRGASLVNVLVFFLIAFTITAQAFFFLENSAESLSEEREMMQIRLKLDKLVDDAKDWLKTSDPATENISISLWGDYQNGEVYGNKYSLFSDTKSDGGTKLSGDVNTGIFSLYYTLMNRNDKTAGASTLNKWVNNEVKDMYRRIYPALGKNYYLIRARVQLPAGNYIMRQVVVYSGDTKFSEELSEEVFYW